MRLQLTALLLVAILPIAVMTSPQHETGAAQKQSDGTEREIRTTLEQLYAAWSGLDPAKAAPFYAKDPELVFFDVAPMKYTGWSEYAAGVPKAFARYRSAKFMLNDDLRVHRHGNLAWVTATWSGELSMKVGAYVHMYGRYTAVLEKRGEKWLIIHEHMSTPLSADGQ